MEYLKKLSLDMFSARGMTVLDKCDLYMCVCMERHMHIYIYNSF